MLWACLLLPRLALDVFARAQAPWRQGAARPFAVTTGGHYPRIVSADAAAAAAGIRAGMLVSAALALAPAVLLRDRDPAGEARALAAVATWATQFTPGVSLAPPDAVLVDIGDSLRLFGGLAALRTRLQQGAAALGYAAWLAIAPTAVAALLLARAGHADTLVRVEALPAALAPLPLALTDADPGIVATLAAAGITTFGAASSLPRAGLARRGGAPLLATLEHALGVRADPRPRFVPPQRYAGRLELPAPVDATEALAFAVQRLVVELAGWLLGRGLGVLELALTLEHEHHLRRHLGTPGSLVRFALAAPAREVPHLLAVLRERLARVTLPGPVEAIVLESTLCAPLAGRNLGLLPGDHDRATVPLLDRLRARLGEDAVTRIAPCAEHRPERAWTGAGLRPAAGNAAAPRSGKKSAPRLPRRAAADTSPSLPLPAGPRPLWLLAEPEPLGARLAARPWVLQDGPERIESGWWDGRDVRRDYFVAESPAGERVWIYRDGRHGFGEGDGEWFVHGLFA
ncbi:MAG: DNA polymerase Y family protein [Betaproteobacteria bacterium]|nr:DNA polymerase Y family protein [Betaproteobacteria bacterium]